jgi:hypothetical protein
MSFGLCSITSYQRATDPGKLRGLLVCIQLCIIQIVCNMLTMRVAGLKVSRLARRAASASARPAWSGVANSASSAGATRCGGT